MPMIGPALPPVMLQKGARCYGGIRPEMPSHVLALIDNDLQVGTMEDRAKLLHRQSQKPCPACAGEYHLEKEIEYEGILGTFQYACRECHYGIVERWGLGSREEYLELRRLIHQLRQARKQIW